MAWLYGVWWLTFPWRVFTIDLLSGCLFLVKHACLRSWFWLGMLVLRGIVSGFKADIMCERTEIILEVQHFRWTIHSLSLSLSLSLRTGKTFSRLDLPPKMLLSCAT